MLRILQNIAAQYRSSNSVEKIKLNRSLLKILETYPNDVSDRNLREAGLAEQALHAAIKAPRGASWGSSHSKLARNAIVTLARVVTKLDLLSDGYVFAQELLESFESIARKTIELAVQPQDNKIVLTGYPFPVTITVALLSNSNYSTVLASPAAPAILKVLLQSLLASVPYGLFPASHGVTYRALAYNVSRTPVQASGHAPQTILEKLEAETKDILSQCPVESLVEQMNRFLGEIQDYSSLQDFYYVVTRFLMTGHGLQVNLLRHGRLHIPMVNAWWRVGRVVNLQIRLHDATAPLSADPLALKTIDELLSVLKSRDIQRQVLIDLLDEGDLMHLLGRVVSLRDLSPEADTWYPITWQYSVIRRLAMMCRGHRSLIDGLVQGEWLYVGERLAAIARSSPITDDTAASLRQQHNWSTFPEQLRKWDILDLWSSYARELGFESNEALEEENESRKAALGGDAGCHWIRCPFYGGDMIEFGINVLRCTGCGEHCLPETALEARYPSVNMPGIEHV
ncbi:hypothetical protein FRC04_007070 [Tulasnella sp. 424]|nr:hypothetical protein FRC04_007070 [Tulasnella sp. 424]KAG8976908.1 hypothetical protein FRC05_002845 [Tulasnella sp. 425]